jgi:hypothetical protein
MMGYYPKIRGLLAIEHFVFNTTRITSLQGMLSVRWRFIMPYNTIVGLPYKPNTKATRAA